MTHNDPSQNGSRLDRIERDIDHLLSIQARHDEHLAKHDEQLDRIAGVLEVVVENEKRLTERLDSLATAQRQTDDKVAKLTENVAELTENMNAFIRVVDGIERRPPPPTV